MLHLRSLIDENLAQGMSADVAWHEAQTRFGSLRRYADECRRVFQRDHFMTQKLAVAALLLLGVLTGWVAVEVRALRDEQQLARAQAGESSAERCDVQGLVVDRDGKPLADAHVLVVLKTWPDGWYHQENFATTSDAEGRFRLAKLLPTDGHREVLVASLKNGHALTSVYQEKWVEGRPAIEPIVLKLDDAADVTIVVRDRGGRPVPRASVVPAVRRTSGGEEHLVYLQAARPIRAVSNREGRVGLGCFQHGDEAEVWIQVPGEDWERRCMTVPGDGEAITLSSDKSVQETDGGVDQRSSVGRGGNNGVGSRTGV
jgi:hypothetical protein